MDRSTATNPLILLLAMTVVGTTAGSRLSTRDAGGSQSSALAGAQTLLPTESPGYRSVLKRYFGPEFTPERLCEQLKGYKVHLMVATLPDPSDPHLADTFDNYLASIELALARDEYLADQYWLPWEEKRRRDRGKQPLAVNNAPGSWLIVVNSGSDANKDELLDQPGIVLFRKPHLDGERGESDELFFLLIVPETPTAGIGRATLQTALEQAAELRRCPPTGSDGKDIGKADHPQTIRILGPSYSGGAASLASGIKDWNCDRHQFQFKIITGSATNSDTRTTLLSVPGVSFSATVLPDEAVDVFYDYLAETFGSQRIALLTESNTSYGQGEQKQRDKQREKKEKNYHLLHLSFPLHVSQVGAEYEKARTQRMAASAAVEVTQLPSLNLLEEDEPHDVPPAMSALTKYNSEISLINSLAVIARGDFNPVGILATDTRDELFLAQMIRRLTPDVQVFLMEADLLFSHPALADAMRGALVVSRYPLYNLNQIWTPPVQIDPRVQFPNGSSQGVYNAAIFHLRDIEREQGSPGPWPMPLEYGEPFKPESTAPPLWVGMVGHKQIWPLATLEVETGQAGGNGYTAAVARAGEKCPSEKDPDTCFNHKPWLVVPQGRLHTGVAMFLFAFILWHAAHWYAAGIRRKEDAARPRLGSAPRSQFVRRIKLVLDKFVVGRHPLICQMPKSLPAGSRRQRAYASLMLFGWQALIASYIAVLAPLIAPLVAKRRLVRDGAWPVPSWLPANVELMLWGTSVGLCLLMVVALYLGKKRVPLKPLPLYWLAGAVVMILSLYYIFDIAWGSRAAAQIFLWVRASNWLSGISPTLPLIFLGAASYATTWLNLYRFAGVPSVGAKTRPLRELLPDIGQRLKEAEQRGKGVMQGRWIVGGLSMLIFMMLTAATIVIFTIRKTAEPDSWTWLVRVLLGLLIVAIVHGLVMLVQIWRTIRRTADELSGHSVVSTLKNMQAMLAAMLGPHPYAASPRRKQLLATEHARVSELQKSAAECTTLDQAVKWAVDKLKGPWSAYDKEDWARPAEEILALEVVRTLGRRVAIIRALISVLTIDALILLLVTNLYPFQPHGSLSGLSWFLLLAVVIVTVWTLIDLDRHAILSYASGSEAGKVSWDASFVFHLLLFAVLPITALIAAHFPEIGRPIVESLQPLLHSAR